MAAYDERSRLIAELASVFAGIRSPNPFWLASAPPTNTAYQVHHAFEAGWGGAVWKTIGAPVLNVSNRYGAWHSGNQRMLGINNIELISDRPVDVNLREIAEIKRQWPDRALIVSAMVESTPEAWKTIVRQIEDTGADGIELNYGCPHGMNERGMGSAVGQVPEYCEQITSWVKRVSSIPVIVKLTPNVTNIVLPARAALAGGADALSLINTINSIMGVDLNSLEISPSIGGKGGHGGYAGPAIKPIALNLLSAIANDPVIAGSGIPISAMGGISTWSDAAEFIALGASNVQICTAAMHYGFRIIDDLAEGLGQWLDSKAYASVEELRGKALPSVTAFENLDLKFRSVARINSELCIQCNLCFIACHDAAHQCIDMSRNDEYELERSNRPFPVVREDDCVGCRLCHNVCPVDGCIEMVNLPQTEPLTTWADLVTERPAIATDWEAMKEYRRQAGFDIH